MYCGRCGKAIDENAAFCPSCGTKTGFSSQKMYDASMKPDTYGKLLVSTKVKPVSAILIVCGFVYFGFGIFFASNFDVFYKIGKDFFRNENLGELLGVVTIAFFFLDPIIMILIGITNRRSYCNVYENIITGITRKTPMEKFELSYGDIKNVTKSGRMIVIYTQFATYNVLAMKNRTEAVRAIQVQLHR